MISPPQLIDVATLPGFELPYDHGMLTVTGRTFYPFAPKAEHVSRGDIINALVRLPRYYGHTMRFYSVAEHTLLMHDLSHMEHFTPSDWHAYHERKQPYDATTLRLYIMLHDAAEAYCGDMIAPIKNGIGPLFAEHVEAPIFRVICERFSLPPQLPEYVAWLDRTALIIERASDWLFPLRGNDGDQWSEIDAEIERGGHDYEGIAKRMIPCWPPHPVDLVERFDSIMQAATSTRRSPDTPP